MKPMPSSPEVLYTHAGGIVCRAEKGMDKYLLVRPKKKKDEWVFPKGHIEPGEKETDAAVREVAEETGVLARIVSRVGDVEFDTSREHVRAVFYLMEYLRSDIPQEIRETVWAPFDEALELLSHESNRDLLRSAREMRPAGYSAT